MIDGISEALNRAIKEEVAAKEARDSDRDLILLRKTVARSKISELEDLKELELLQGYE